MPEEGVCAHIASACGGDVRKAMNAVELSAIACDSGGPHIEVTLEARSGAYPEKRHAPTTRTETSTTT